MDSAKLMSRAWVFLTCCCAFLAVPQAARGQCTRVWRPLIANGAASPNGPVNAMVLWDPDGAGPESSKLVIGGEFTMIGTLVANRIAMYDLVSGAWSTFGTGIGGGVAPKVFDLLSMPDGSLVVGGSFTTAGDQQITSIARWNGMSWSGFGWNQPISAITSMSNGNLLAVGSGFVQLWNGSSWRGLSRVGVPFEWNEFYVVAVAVSSSGTIYVSGSFQSEWDIVARPGLRRGTVETGGWGISWELPPRVLTADAIGNVYAGYRVPEDACYRFSGGPGAPMNAFSGFRAYGYFEAMAILPDQRPIAAGNVILESSGVPDRTQVLVWNGSAWELLGRADLRGAVKSLVALPNGDVIAGGSFSATGTVSARTLALWGCPPPSCDSIDFNRDGLFPDDVDLVDFLNVLAGGTCSTGTCNDIDFNNDGLFPDDNDIIAYLRVRAGGPCQ